MMDRLDRSYEVRQGAAYREFSPLVKQRPSEYIRSGRIYVSCEGSEETLRYAMDRLGSGCVLYASDFPHESNLEARHEIAELEARADLSEETKQDIFEKNVERFYQV